MTTQMGQNAVEGDEVDQAFLEAARPYWHPVARSVDLDPSATLAVTLLGEELVLWRSPDGHVGVVDDLCAHRGTRLSQGTVTDEGCIRCPYHAWEYDRGGQCVRIPQLASATIPATARVPSYQVDEHAGLIWACLVGPGEEKRPRPVVPLAEEAGWHLLVQGPMAWPCQSPRQIENFTDLGHFSVLHADVFGNPNVMEIDPYTVERSDDGWQLKIDYTYPALDMFGDWNDHSRPESPIRLDYRIELPFCAYLRSMQAGMEGLLYAANQPVGPRTSNLFWISISPEELAIPDEFLIAYQEAVINSDVRVVSGQRPERLPLDLSAELHLPFDRFAVAYRRALGDLGFPVWGDQRAGQGARR